MARNCLPRVLIMQTTRPTTNASHFLLSKLLGVLLLVLLSPHSLASGGLPAFLAEYTVSRNGSEIGVRTHRLSKTDKSYLYEARMHTTGLASFIKPGTITERSHWRLIQQRVVPHKYEYLDSSDEDRNSFLDFDWRNNSVMNHVGNKPWQMPIPDGTQDKFGYMIALMQDLQKGNTEPEYRIADGGRLKTYRFKALGNEVIATPAGKFNTLKLRGTREDKKNPVTYIWCLPEKNYLPVKIERHRKDTVYTMSLNRLEGL